MIIPKEKPEIKVFWNPNKKTEEIIPYEVLFEIFSAFTLEEIRKELWIFLKAALEDPEDTKPSRVVYIYENLFDLCTVAYMLAEKKYLKNNYENYATGYRCAKKK